MCSWHDFFTILRERGGSARSLSSRDSSDHRRTARIRSPPHWRHSGITWTSRDQSTQPYRSARFLHRDREEKRQKREPSIWRTNKIRTRDEHRVDSVSVPFSILDIHTGLICSGDRRNGYGNGPNILNSSLEERGELATRKGKTLFRGI